MAGKNLGDLSGDLRRSMVKIRSEAMVQIQAELGDDQVSPRDTGRFRSSWFASAGSPSSAVAPEGADSPNTDAQGLVVPLNQTAWLSNNLPYAERVAVEGIVVSQSPTWFHAFRDVRIPKLLDAATRAVKQEEGF